ncbi:MAG: DUF378 domain-containing protein [Candidatus Binatia bacterium]
MKTIRAIGFILIIIIFGAIYWALLGLLQIDALAALMDGPTSTVSRIVYALIGIAGLIAAVIVFDGASGRFNILGRIGRSSGADRGPAPGDGAVIHHSSGEADFGVPGNVLPPANKADRDQPFPPDRSAD